MDGKCGPSRYTVPYDPYEEIQEDSLPDIQDDDDLPLYDRVDDNFLRAQTRGNKMKSRSSPSKDDFASLHDHTERHKLMNVEEDDKSDDDVHGRQVGRWSSGRHMRIPVHTQGDDREVPLPMVIGDIKEEDKDVYETYGYEQLQLYSKTQEESEPPLTCLMTSIEQLQLDNSTDRDDSEGPLVGRSRALVVTPDNRAITNMESCTSVRRKKLFTPSSRPQTFLPTDIQMEHTSPHSIVKSQLRTPKLVSSFVNRHR